MIATHHPGEAGGHCRAGYAAAFTREGFDLTGTLISHIVLQLLSYVAQTEREFIHQRQREGIATAIAKNVKFDAKPNKRFAEYDAVFAVWKRGKISE